MESLDSTTDARPRHPGRLSAVLIAHLPWHKHDQLVPRRDSDQSAGASSLDTLGSAVDSSTDTARRTSEASTANVGQIEEIGAALVPSAPDHATTATHINITATDAATAVGLDKQLLLLETRTASAKDLLVAVRLHDPFLARFRRSWSEARRAVRRHHDRMPLHRRLPRRAAQKMRHTWSAISDWMERMLKRRVRMNRRDDGTGDAEDALLSESKVLIE